MSRSSSWRRVGRPLAALVTPVLVISTLAAIASSPSAQAAGGTGPEPAGWYAGDMHVHRSCGGTAESLDSIKTKMDAEDLRFIALLADCGNGEVQNPTTDLPLVDGQDASISTAGRTVHWDSEWHWDATYGQYEHQALGGHLVNLGQASAAKVWDEMPSRIIEGVHDHGGISGFAHLQYLPSGIPNSLDCCTPVDYPVEVALGSADFISEDVTNTGDTAIEAYYKLLNTGFRPGFAAGTDYPCGNDLIGSRLTYSNLGSGDVTYRNWIDAIKSGRTVISRNGHNEFLDLTVNGSAGPGDEVDLAGAGSVPVTVTWTARADYTGQLQLVQNGQVIASRTATVTAGSPVTLTADVDFAKSGWVAARRMDSNGINHQVHTAAAFVLVNDAPIRVSADDAQFYVDWMDNLLAKTSPGGEWNAYFLTELAAAQARYEQAKAVFQQRKAESESVPPTVSSRLPATGASGVAVTTAPTVTFSEPVAAASVTASSVSLKVGSTVVPATVSVSGATVTLTPSAALAFGTVYTVSVSTGVTDLAGNHLASPVSWSFTTASGAFSAPTPTISDTTPVVGQVLSADAGTWVPAPDVRAYQWLRGSTEISGATSSSYTAQAADLGSALSVRVTGSKVGYASVSRTSDPTVEIATGTLVPATPTIDDTTPEVGQVLTAAEGTWVPAPDSFTYQWLRGSTVVGTARTYVVTAGDVGLTLAVRVTGSKAGYTTTSTTSAATAAVPVPVPVQPPASPNPTITGVARVGMPLTASLGTWNPAPTKVTYQWYRLKSSGARVAIKKATKPAYTPTKAVQGRELQVRIRVSVAGRTLTQYSPPSGKVGAPMKARTPKVSDTTPKVGQTLTAKTGSWKPTRTAFTYQWYAKSTAGKVAAIAGATSRTYQVEARFAGYRLKVSVTGRASGYRPVLKTSGYSHKVSP